MPCGSTKESCNQDKSGANGHCAFEDLDHSALQQPLNLGVTNVKQILKCIQSGSREIKDIILNECNIIYECKACVGLFRSLANFLYHKRCYCKKHLCEDMLLFENFEEAETVTVQPEPPKPKPEECAMETQEVTDCTVDLVKSGDVAQEATSDTSKDSKPAPEASDDSKEKNNSAGNNKAKGKPTPEPEKVKNPMISRRTRDKNAQNPTSTSKLAAKVGAPDEPPLKCVKIGSPAKISDEEPEIIFEGPSDVSPVDNKKEQSDTSSKEIKSKKVEIAKFAANADKNTASFPKIIFKTIDSNPHAVFQSNDKKKLETFGVSKKFEASAVETKVDNDKLIIVLKKDVKSDNSSESKVNESSKQKSDAEKASGFHLTRRNRLLVRTDCDVHELKCLVCKTQFMSLKTLYFHMLSLHSKKRLYYPCPFCKTLFVQMYGVTRHLISIHNKTKEQINKLRDVIKKKSVWKKIDDVSPSSDKNFSVVNYQVKTNTQEEVTPEPSEKASDNASENENTEADSLKTVIKLGKNVTLHQCSKCSRVFGRKSSQVSHQKFCIMNNAVKTDSADVTTPGQQANPPVVSFLSLSPTKPPMPSKPASILQFKPESNAAKLAETEKQAADMKISIRPKRGAEKQMHKDFVNSQTLKWRSANRIETNSNPKTPPPPKKPSSSSNNGGNGKNLEKKVLSIMDAENLTCLKCDKKFSSYSNLRRHVAIHVGWTRFKCKYCEYQAYNKSQCWSHVQKAHFVDDCDMDKSIVNLVNSGVTPPPKKSVPSSSSSASSSKRSSIESSVKTSSKTNNIPKVKISKKKSTGSIKNANSEKKQQQQQQLQLQTQKKDLPEPKKDVAKEVEKELVENKKDKPQPAIPPQKILKKDVSDTKKEKSQTTITFQKVPRKEIVESKKEKPQHIIPIQKLTIPDYKRDTNYKSVTTSNPTTIILSKKIPSSTVQSIVTISPESVSSASKMSPIRTSPRKNEIKGPGERLITTLVTRSSTGPKSSSTPIQIKLPARSNSVENISKECVDKNFSKKERLISEWFPKKDMSSPTVRRESAPLIIGLVPAVNNAGLNAKAKSPATAFDKSSSSS